MENNAPGDHIKNWEITKRAWEQVDLDKDGNLVHTFDAEQWQSEAYRRRLELRNKARGLVRSIVIVIDLSSAGLLSRDFGCSRIHLIKQSLKKFITNFFDQNPISQISIVSTSNGRAQILSYLCGALDIHLKCLETLSDYTEEGTPSLHNAMNVSIAILKSAAKYSTREILMIYGSLHTCDNSPIDPTLKQLKLNKVVVNTIGFGASVHILNRLSSETGGLYFVPMSIEHFHDILNANIEPPEWSAGFKRLEFIPFGFVQNKDNLPSFDITELRSMGKPMPKFDGCTCPKCNFHVFAVPVYCPSCGILLLTPDHITRTKFQMASVPNFVPIGNKEPCSTCCVIGDEMYKCPKCEANYCKHCNNFIHTVLNRCPSCALSNIY
ncbi:General transcription factor IIH subunit 2 [Tritrichomonas foetus]|uniref:General transcription factor IIH subunit 2 n=1 Tax=Tritrichomonas foetus TaxID=1144522 RepID=A0A1J4KMN9_9EUKA|nr:General transcription factor IIH subunit 2 [Tritrichomonas foetus]|eukprot:OHT10637.1 General transcription factor IIH subunit 2 [Tritrichomonas foetus]